MTSRKSLGFVRTPRALADELVRWAIEDPNDEVLDLGAGEGVFLRAASSRLRQLGAKDESIAEQLHGVEREQDLYARTQSALRSEIGRRARGLLHGDFFASRFPKVDAVIGNPPYVRRGSLEDVEWIHNQIRHENLFIGEIPRLTDLYAYFIIHSERFLKTGGRLAVIVSSSWLDTRYGEFFKRFLLNHFSITAVVHFDKRVFGEALVKAVLLAAVKRSEGYDGIVRFVRLSDFQPGVLMSLEATDPLPGERCHYVVPQNQLNPREPWSPYLRAPEAYSIAHHHLTDDLGQLVESRIGVQPLASDFFILTNEKAQQAGLDDCWLKPLARSPRDVPTGLIADPSELPWQLLVVGEASGSSETRALHHYIRQAEEAVVKIRGKPESVRGYHELPRLKLAGRKPWYSLKREIQRRGQYPIFLPRRFFERFLIVWNKAGVIAGENFIELRPRISNQLAILLALLNSSIFEIVARSRAQQYGGGVYNLNPKNVQSLPFFSISRLGSADRLKIEAAGLEYLAQPTSELRRVLDENIASATGMDWEEVDILQAGLQELRAISTRSKSTSLVK